MLVVPAAVVRAPQGDAPAALETLDDAALVVRAQAGDRAALAVLCERMRLLVIAFLRARFGLEPAVLEDLAAEVVWRLLTRLGRYQPAAGVPFRAWVYRIARNLLVDTWRLHATSQGVPREVGMGEIVARAAARVGARSSRQHAALHWELALSFVTMDQASVDGGYDQTDRQRAIAAALATLTPDQRRCVELRWLGGYSIEETARRMARDGDAIKQLQVQAFRRLRLLLADYAPGAPA